MNEPATRKLSGVNVAITVLATLVIAMIAYSATTHAVHPDAVALPTELPAPWMIPTSPPVEPPPTPPTAAPRLFIWGFDLINARTGWILLTNCTQPMTGRCQYMVAGTADGGQTWSALVQVGPSYDPADGGAPRTIRFINAADGFVYGAGGAFVSHDGGRTWRPLDLPANFVNAISGHGQTVWVTTYPCPKGILCGYEVRSSRDGGWTWSAPRRLPVGFSPSDVVSFGPSDALIWGPPSGELVMTTDGGITWRPIKGSCSDTTFRALVTSSDGHEIWELCLGIPGNASASKVLSLSEDGGKTWSQKASSHSPNSLPSLGTEVSLVSPRPYMVLLGTDQTPLFLTRNAAASWIQVLTSPIGGSLSIRFAGASDGWAIGAGQTTIWSTRDGGENWTPLRVDHPPS